MGHVGPSATSNTTLICGAWPNAISLKRSIPLRLRYRCQLILFSITASFEFYSPHPFPANRYGDQTLRVSRSLNPARWRKSLRRASSQCFCSMMSIKKASKQSIANPCSAPPKTIGQWLCQPAKSFKLQTHETPSPLQCDEHNAGMVLHPPWLFKSLAVLAYNMKVLW